jgi:hypothetical protein
MPDRARTDVPPKAATAFRFLEERVRLRYAVFGLPLSIRTTFSVRYENAAWAAAVVERRVKAHWAGRRPVSCQSSSVRAEGRGRAHLEANAFAGRPGSELARAVEVLRRTRERDAVTPFRRGGECAQLQASSQPSTGGAPGRPVHDERKVKGFPIPVVRDESEEVVVFAVARSSTQPGYWLARLR